MRLWLTAILLLLGGEGRDEWEAVKQLQVRLFIYQSTDLHQKMAPGGVNRICKKTGSSPAKT
jgi:hypothetical protein